FGAVPAGCRATPKRSVRCWLHICGRGMGVGVRYEDKRIWPATKLLTSMSAMSALGQKQTFCVAAKNGTKWPTYGSMIRREIQNGTRLLSRGAYKGEIAAKHPIEPQPPWQLFCKLLVALDRHRTAYHVAPTRLA